MPKTRREERREATASEIKALAWKQMSQDSPAALSLRAIARDMRMSSAAIFRYFANRDALLNGLSHDAYQSQYEALWSAMQSVPCLEHTRRIWVTAEAYRAWALANPGKYALIYGTPIPNYRPDWPAIIQVARQSLDLFISLIDEAARAGVISSEAQLTEFSSALTGQLQGIIAQRGYETTPWVVYTAFAGWSRLHGLVSLEVVGALKPIFSDTYALFCHELASLIWEIGYKTDPSLYAKESEGWFTNRLTL